MTATAPTTAPTNVPVVYQQTTPGNYEEYGQYGGSGGADYAFPHADDVNTGQTLLGFPIFGAPSQPAVTPRTTASTGGVSHVATNPAIVSSTGVQGQFNDASNQLDQIVSTPDPYAGLVQTQIQNEYAANAAAEQAANSSATAKAANDQNMYNSQSAATNYGIRAEDAANGTAQLNPEGQAMQLSAATQSFQAKFNAIDQAEKIAIANATAARANADVKTMNENIEYAKYAQQVKQQQTEQAWREYAFNHLSADQQSSIGIQNNRLAWDKYVAQFPGASTTSATSSGIFNKTTTSNVSKTGVPAGALVGGTFYPTAPGGDGQTYYKSPTGWLPLNQ